MNNEYHDMARPIEPKGMSINKKLKSKLGTVLILIGAYFGVGTGINYLLADIMLNQGESPKQIESFFNSVKKDKRTVPKLVDFMYNSYPQKVGRDIAYYLNKK